MRYLFIRNAAMAAMIAGALSASSVMAQTTVTLPNDSGQTTTFTADVSEQAKVQVPAGITFNVTDISSSTAATAASVNVTNIVLASATKQLKISLQAGAAGFTPSVEDAETWSAGDVTWNQATWTNATGASGTLSPSAFNEVATCDADAAACSTSALVFTLGAKTSVKRSGDHTLSMTWKFESIGS